MPRLTEPTPADPSRDRLIGRDRELDRLRSLVAATAVGTGQVVLIAGEAGIGKSALLGELQRDAGRSGFRELRCDGETGSEKLGFQGLRDLLDPVLNLADRLPQRQQSALLTAFGQSSTPAPDEPLAARPDQLLTGLGVLGVLEELAGEGPVLVTVDDLQWLDDSTVAVLRFLSRRLANAPILLAMTVRTASADTDVPWMAAESVLTLEPLGPADSAGLLNLVAEPLSEFTRERLLRMAAGNPLALRELPVAWRVLDQDQQARLPEQMPVTERLQQAFLAEVAQLPAGSRHLLLLAAAAHQLSVQELGEVARRAGLTPEDLDPLEQSGLLSISAGRWHFRHPLVSSAVYWAASADERADAHRILASTVPDPARAAWHRATAVDGVDEEVAAELERAGRESVRRGATREAASAMYRAASITPPGKDRNRRLAWAAEMSRRYGRYAAAAMVIEEALPTAEDPFSAAMLGATELGIYILGGVPGRPIAELIQLVQKMAGPDGRQAGVERTQLLWAMAIRCAVRPHTPAEAAAVAAELIAVNAGREAPSQRIALALLDPLTYSAVRPELPSLITHIRTDERVLLTAGLAAEALQDLPTALAAWIVIVDQEHRVGASADQAQALTSLARIRIVLGDLTQGADDADLALQIATLTATTGLGPLLAAAHGSRALARAWLGRNEAALEAVAQARAAEAPRAMDAATASWAAGLVALDEGRAEDAWRELSRTSINPKSAAWAVADLAEAAVQCGQQAAASQAVESVEEVLLHLDSDHLRTLVHRAHALLGPEHEAEAHHQASIAHGRTSGAPLELARSRLAYGEWLRRQRRVTDARPHLQEALRALETGGAAGWAGRAQRELRAAGVSSGRTETVRAADKLTAEERQIAEMAASGLTNKEIADRLYLSHRTVGARLYRLFPKLGITSRHQLAQALTR